MKRILRGALHRIQRALGQCLPDRLDVHCQTSRYGSDYGGWDIITKNITQASIIYSIGVGEDASFDIEFIEQHGVTIHAFDPTPKSIAWVAEQELPANFVMHSYGIADHDGTVSFNPPENPDHVSHTILDRPATQGEAITVPVKRLKSIMKELGHRHIDILKMDIEGAEYRVISDVLRSGIRPQQWLIEFHHRFAGVGTKQTIRAIRAIKSAGYGIFSISRSKEEYCFVHQA